MNNHYRILISLMLIFVPLQICASQRASTKIAPQSSETSPFHTGSSPFPRIIPKMGMFLEGMNVIPKSLAIIKEGKKKAGKFTTEEMSEDPIFIYKAANGKLLAFAYSSEFAKRAESLKAGEKINAFIEINTAYPEESEVVSINIIPPSYEESLSKGVYVKNEHNKNITLEGLQSMLETLPSIKELKEKEVRHLLKIERGQDLQKLVQELQDVLGYIQID